MSFINSDYTQLRILMMLSGKLYKENHVSNRYNFIEYYIITLFASQNTLIFCQNEHYTLMPILFAIRTNKFGGIFTV